MFEEDRFILKPNVTIFLIAGVSAVAFLGINLLGSGSPSGVAFNANLVLEDFSCVEGSVTEEGNICASECTGVVRNTGTQAVSANLVIKAVETGEGLKNPVDIQGIELGEIPAGETESFNAVLDIQCGKNYDYEYSFFF